FESIHPFLDGNGRLGRLLITFLLCAEGALSEPMLYLSLYFKQHRQAYYDTLQRVRTHGEWENWLRFFLEGVAQTATQAAGTAKKILLLFSHDRRRIEALGRQAGSSLRVHQLLQKKPIVSIQSAGKALKLSVPTVTTAVSHLLKLNLLKELTGGSAIACLFIKNTWTFSTKAPSR
ncbi:MAG: Fic family protein, partial [candidate division KSB1 bacterium]